jgi:uncharacterized protein YoxC
MKELLLRIASMIIAIAIVLSLCTLVLQAKLCNSSINLCLDKIDAITWQNEAYRIDSEKELIDKIEELTRDNERYKMENAALVDYINGFEDKFWKE